MPITNANRILHDTQLCNQSCPSRMQTEFFMTPICAINHSHHKCKQNSSWHPSVQSIMPITNANRILHDTYLCNQSCPSQIQAAIFMSPIFGTNHVFYSADIIDYFLKKLVTYRKKYGPHAPILPLLLCWLRPLGTFSHDHMTMSDR